LFVCVLISEYCHIKTVAMEDRNDFQKNLAPQAHPKSLGY